MAKWPRPQKYPKKHPKMAKKGPKIAIFCQKHPFFHDFSWPFSFSKMARKWPNGHKFQKILKKLKKFVKNDVFVAKNLANWPKAKIKMARDFYEFPAIFHINFTSCQAFSVPLKTFQAPLNL